MGQPKNGGYSKMSTVTPEQQTMYNQMIQQATGNMGGAADIYKGFAPGGDAANAITQQMQQRFQQQTMPQIMNAFGSGSKGSSALNQALAAGGANLNTDIASMLAQAQLGAAGGMAQLGTAQGQMGGSAQFAYQPTAQAFWKQLLLAGMSNASQTGKSMLAGGTY
jgi:hypothetical protein